MLCAARMLHFRLESTLYHSYWPACISSRCSDLPIHRVFYMESCESSMMWSLLRFCTVFLTIGVSPLCVHAQFSLYDELHVQTAPRADVREMIVHRTYTDSLYEYGPGSGVKEISFVARFDRDGRPLFVDTVSPGIDTWDRWQSEINYNSSAQIVNIIRTQVSIADANDIHWRDTSLVQYSGRMIRIQGVDVAELWFDSSGRCERRMVYSSADRDSIVYSTDYLYSTRCAIPSTATTLLANGDTLSVESYKSDTMCRMVKSRSWTPSDGEWYTSISYNDHGSVTVHSSSNSFESCRVNRITIRQLGDTVRTTTVNLRSDAKFDRTDESEVYNARGLLVARQIIFNGKVFANDVVSYEFHK